MASHRKLQHPERRVDDAPDSQRAMCEGKGQLTYEQALAIIRRDKTKAKRVVAYKCPKCRCWHIGGPSFGAAPKKPKRRPRNV